MAIGKPLRCPPRLPRCGDGARPPRRLCHRCQQSPSSHPLPPSPVRPGGSGATEAGRRTVGSSRHPLLQGSWKTARRKRLVNLTGSLLGKAVSPWRCATPGRRRSPPSCSSRWPWCSSSTGRRWQAPSPWKARFSPTSCVLPQETTRTETGRAPPHHREVLAPPDVRRALLFGHRGVARNRPVRRDGYGERCRLPALPERRRRLLARGCRLPVLRRPDGREGGRLALARRGRRSPPARAPAPGFGRRLGVRPRGPPFRGLFCLPRALRTRPSARAILLRSQRADHGRSPCPRLRSGVHRRGWRLGSTSARCSAWSLRGCGDASTSPGRGQAILPAPPKRCPRPVPTFANLVGVLVLFGVAGLLFLWGNARRGSSTAWKDESLLPLAAVLLLAASTFFALCWTWRVLDPLSGGGALVSVAWGVLSVRTSRRSRPLARPLTTRYWFGGASVLVLKSGLRRAHAGGRQAVPLRPRGGGPHPTHTPVLRLRNGVPSRGVLVRRRKG